MNYKQKRKKPVEMPMRNWKVATKEIRDCGIPQKDYNRLKTYHKKYLTDDITEERQQPQET